MKIKEGKIKARGRIASLLEVGTGFHPELTGRENIFFNGAINGMSKKETAEKLDQIVEFAGVEKFLDTPVKRYSSGMHVRLGFAVAAHLDPDILIVDEVLAIGDANFQKKAINKMRDVSKKKGRTVLFVSHNMESIRKLCTRTIVMSRGAIVQDGNTEDSINKYLGSIVYESREYKKVSWNNINDAPGGDILRLKSISTKDEVGKLRNQFKLNEKIIIETEFNVLKSGYQVSCVLLFSFYSSKNFLPNGNFYVIDNYVKNEWGKQKSFDIGNYLSRLEMPKNIL